ncbi:hypothetical protein B0H13DRAFT_2034594 [Mycena leptocephala]|nr:hypothetical protein B0H13DRAFT_2034594 [Mycena leptocephala]
MPHPLQLDPTSSSSDRSVQNLAQLRTNWKWAAFSQFFYTFPIFLPWRTLRSPSDIEDDLARETNIFLPRVMTRLLFIYLASSSRSSLDNWQAALRKQHNRRDPTSNPIGPEPHSASPEPRYRYESVSVDDATRLEGDLAASDMAGSALASDSRANTEEKASPTPDPTGEEEQESKNWLDLPMLAKLDSMHLLTEWQFQNPTRLRTLMKSDDEDATWFRIEPIGYDAKSNAYWLIGADRLWIQRAHPKPPRYTATTPENTAKASATKSKRPAAKRARLASEDPKLTITVPGGGRAAKAQAKLKLDAQAKELAELNRAAGLRGPATRASHGGRTPVAPVRPLGTRVSARLRGADEEEWQAVPEDWLTEGGSKKKTPVKPKPKTGLESDDDSVSDLTELSEEPIEEVKEDEESAEVEEASQAEENREDGQPEGFVEWETICVTLSDWEHIAERFEKGTHYTEKALYKVLVKEIVPVITEELREIERKRRLEDAIVHRKRSSRIANKESEKEEARLLAQQKAEVAEKKSRAQRLEAQAQEVQSAAEAENESDMHVDVVGSDPSPIYLNQNTFFAPDTSRTATASTSTSGTRTPIGDDWVLNCEICHRSGVNIDDGMSMLCCGLCSQWHHTKCHDLADKQAGRPRRNWDQVEFICRQCQARRMAVKNSGQYPQHTVPSSYVPQTAPLTSYSPYGHGPPPAATHPPRDYPGTYPIAANGASTMGAGPSRQLPYPTPSASATTATFCWTLQYSEPQQQYHGAYDRSPVQQFQHITPNVNGHRPPVYQRPVATAQGWNMPSTGHNPPYTSSNGVSSDRHQYGDVPQWHAGGSQQTAAYGYHNGQ